MLCTAKSFLTSLFMCSHLWAHGQTRARPRGSLQSGTRDRWNQSGGWQGLGYLEGRAGRPSWVGGDGHSETWQNPQHLQGRPAGTTADRAEKGCVS
jgi:hypothetical protein